MGLFFCAAAAALQSSSAMRRARISARWMPAVSNASAARFMASSNVGSGSSSDDGSTNDCRSIHIGAKARKRTTDVLRASCATSALRSHALSPVRIDRQPTRSAPSSQASASTDCSSTSRMFGTTRYRRQETVRPCAMDRHQRSADRMHPGRALRSEYVAHGRASARQPSP